MKAILFPALVILILVGGRADAQTGTSAKKTKSTEFLLTAQTNLAEQHLSAGDVIQRETEDLLLTSAHAPLLALARAIELKFESRKAVKAKHKDKAKRKCNDIVTGI